MIEFTETVALGLIDYINEQMRASKLTNQQLVAEIIERLPFSDLDALLEEAFTRLDPTWNQE